MFDFRPFTMLGFFRPLSAIQWNELPGGAAVYFDALGATHVVLEPEALKGLTADSFRDTSRPSPWAISWTEIPASLGRLFGAPPVVEFAEAPSLGFEVSEPPPAGGLRAAEEGEESVRTPTDGPPEPPKLLRFEEVAIEAVGRIQLTHRFGEPEGFFNRILLGRAYRHFGDFEKAETVFTAILMMPGLNDRQRARSLSERAVTLREAGQVDEAMDVIDTALAFKGTNPHYHCERGVLFRLKGDYGSSLNALDVAGRLNPYNPRFLVEIGLTLGEIAALQAKRKRPAAAARTWEQALQYVEDAIQLGPPHPRHFCEKGKLLRLMRRFNASQEAHLRSIELDDSHPRHHLELAETLQAMGRVEEAEGARDRAAELNARWRRLPDHFPDRTAT